MKKNLELFYEEKYKTENKSNIINIIDYVKYPTNRYQACVKYFKENFKGGDILELGAGNGAITKSIFNLKLKINNYLATDFTNNRIEGIKKNIHESKLKVARLDVENFNANEIGKFDAVIMIALIEHLIDPIKAMSEIKKLLKPNGILYIGTPNVAEYGARLKLLRGKFPSTASRNEGFTKYDNQKVSLHDEGHLHYFTYNSLEIMLKQYCGFTNIKKEYLPVGKLIFGAKFHYKLSKIFPNLFSYIILIAN